MSTTTTNFEPINPELPEHIIFEILTRLPVKSLRRFQCVSKLWNSMISDPDHFARTHYARSAFRPKLLISFNWPGNQLFSADYQRSMVGTSQDHHLLNLWSEFGHFLNGMLYSTRYYYHTKIHSPAALYCAGTDQTRDNSMLCNCMTYFVLNLDEATCKVDHWDDDDDDAFYSEHTIFRRLRFGARPLGDYTDSISIGRIIYSLRDPENIIWDGGWWRGSLIVLDTETEVFYSVPVPSHKNDHRTLVFELRERFAMANDMDVWSGRGNSIVLWVLEDYEKEIWSCKTCLLDVSGSGLKLFGVTPEDELLVAPENLTEGPFCLFFYNLKNETTRRVEVLGLYERFRDELKWFRSYFAPFKTNLDFYVESLQPPKDFRSDVPKSLLCGVEFKELSITE